MEQILYKNVLYEIRQGETGYGKVVKILDEDNVMVKIKGIGILAKVYIVDIIKVY
jgi:hypothetical protein